MAGMESLFPDARLDRIQRQVMSTTEAMEVTNDIVRMQSDLDKGVGRVCDLIEGLGEIYTREGVHIWLTGRHRLLDNRSPLDVMREDGGMDRVEALLEQLRSGAFV